MKFTLIDIFIFSIFISLGISLKAQNEYNDSLKVELLNHTKNDTTRVKILNNLIYDIYEKGLGTAEIYIKESEYLVEKLNFVRGKAQLLYYKSCVNLAKSEFPEAIKNSKLSVGIYESLNNKKGISYSLNNTGIAYYYLGDFPNAIKYIEQSAAIDKERNDLNGMSASFDFMGTINADQGNFKEAIRNYEKAKSIRLNLNDSSKLASIYNNMGTVFFEQSDYPRALENFQKSLNIRNNTKNDAQKLDVLINIAIVYQEQKQYPKALDFLNEGLTISKKLNNERFIAKYLDGLGNIYKEQNKNKEALIFYKEALEFNEKFNIKREIATNLNNIAEIELRFKNDNNSLKYFTRALEINKEIDSPVGKCLSYLGISKVYIHKNNYKKALDFTLKAENLAKKFQLIDAQRDAKELLAEIYQKLGNYKKAFENYQAFKILNDSLFDAESIEKITQLEYEYKYKQELETANIRELKLTETIKEAELNLQKSQRNLLLGVIAFLIISIILGAIIFFLRLRNVKSEAKNVLVEQKLLRSQMTPHFIFNSLSVLQGMILNKEDAKAVSYLSKFSKLLRMILENSRDKTVSLDQELKAVETYLLLQNIEESEPYIYTVLVNNIIDKTQFKIPPMLIQPFIENAIEHAFGAQKENRKIDIHLNFIDKKLICTIKDNGIGINAQIEKKNGSKKSLATTITSERLESLSKDFKMKGSINIEDRKKHNEKGTIVTLIIPYKIEAA